MYLIHDPKFIKNDDFESAWLEFERFKQEGLTKCVSWLLSLAFLKLLFQEHRR